MLARALAAPSNLLALDEPTNDLDIETLDLLQELLSDYAGTILIVSHDRDFLDRVATSVIVAEGGGRWIEYAGGYSDMVAQRGYGLAGPAVTPSLTAPARPPARGAERGPPKRKLSFNEKRALERLPDRIEALRRELAALEASLADVDLAAREPAAFLAATDRYGEVRGSLEKAEDEWLALEILREELES
jgi:ATP-binding cassette subfamily F protein uup